MSLQEVIEDLNVSIKKHPSLTYTIKAMATEKSIEGLEKSLLYAKLEKACLKNGLKVIPHHFEASSDLRFYHALGIEGIGLTPFTCHENLHGTNESVPIKDLIRGRNIFIELLKSL